VSVPVMDIRPVSVNMSHGPVSMDMDVGLLVICKRVGMPVMLIVNVFMQMRNGFMGVEMAVLFPVKQEYSRKHQ